MRNRQELLFIGFIAALLVLVLAGAALMAPKLKDMTSEELLTRLETKPKDHRARTVLAAKLTQEDRLEQALEQMLILSVAGRKVSRLVPELEEALGENAAAVEGCIALMDQRRPVPTWARDMVIRLGRSGNNNWVFDGLYYLSEFSGHPVVDARQKEITPTELWQAMLQLEDVGFNYPNANLYADLKFQLLMVVPLDYIGERELRNLDIGKALKFFDKEMTQNKPYKGIGTAVMFIEALMENGYSKDDIAYILKLAVELAPEASILPGNLVNQGRFHQYRETVYFSTDEGLYVGRVHANSSGLLSAGPAYFINVTENWVYFSDAEHLIHRLNRFERNLGSYDVRGKSLVLRQSWLYYVTPEEEGHSIWRLNVNTSQQEQLMAGSCTGLIYVQGRWLFYSHAQEGGIWRIPVDGGEAQLVTEEAVQNFVVDNGWVYYTNSRGIFRVRIDGRDAKHLSTDTVKDEFSFTVFGDWIYYNYSGDNRVYQLYHDGSKVNGLNLQPAYSLHKLGNWLFYRSNSIEGEPMLMEGNGASRQRASFLGALN